MPFTKIRFSLFFVLIFLFANVSWAQDPIYSQYYNAPLLTNPAFAGNSETPFISTIYRNQWLGFDNAYQTFSASYDQYFSSIKSGLGLSVLSDYAGAGLMRATKINAIYSYKLRITRGQYIKGALDFGFANRRLDWERYTFGDALNPIFGAISPGGSRYPSAEIPPDFDKIQYFDLGVGLLYVTEKVYLGFAFSHINNPENSFYKEGSTLLTGLEMRIIAQGGYQYNFGDPRRSRYGNKPDFVAPNFMYVNHGGYQQINAGASAEVRGLLGGLYYRHSGNNGDAIIASFGARFGPYKINYSFDYNISSIALRGYGSHELSFNLGFYQQRPKVDVSDCLELFR